MKNKWSIFSKRSKCALQCSIIKAIAPAIVPIYIDLHVKGPFNKKWSKQKSTIYFFENSYRLFSWLAIISRWGPYWADDVPWHHQSTYVPSHSVLIDDRKRGHVCRLMTSGTSPTQYGPHRLIIANHEKSLYPAKFLSQGGVKKSNVSNLQEWKYSKATSV